MFTVPTNRNISHDYKAIFVERCFGRNCISIYTHTESSISTHTASIFSIISEILHKQILFIYDCLRTFSVASAAVSFLQCKDHRIWWQFCSYINFLEFLPFFVYVNWCILLLYSIPDKLIKAKITDNQYQYQYTSLCVNAHECKC